MGLKAGAYTAAQLNPTLTPDEENIDFIKFYEECIKDLKISLTQMKLSVLPMTSNRPGSKRRQCSQRRRKSSRKEGINSKGERT